MKSKIINQALLDYIERKPIQTDYPSLASETRTHVNTAHAAFHLSRAVQTLRIWACNESGPLRPTRVNGRLAWSVADIKRLLGVD